MAWRNADETLVTASTHESNQEKICEENLRGGKLAGQAGTAEERVASLHDDGGLAGDLEPLAASHILASHHVVFAHHVGPELGESCPVAFVSSAGKLTFLGADHPSDFVVRRLVAMWTVQ